LEIVHSRALTARPPPMRLSLNQSQRLEQRLVQSPQMIQAMQILQLSTLDLQERIEEEMLENPFLEEAEGAEEGETPGETPTDPVEQAAQEATEDALDPNERADLENMLDEFERYDRELGDGTRTRVSDNGEADRKLEAMQNTAADYHSLGGALLDQLALSDFDERQHLQAEFVTYSLDPRGYLPEPLDVLAEACEVENTTPEELAVILEALRHATHPAIGARDLRECLLLQLDAHDVDAPLARTLIENHLEDLTTNRLPRISKATGHTIEEIKQAIETLRSLDPLPGREYGELPAATIHPDVIVEEIDGKFEVKLTRDGVPRLTISPTYRNLLRQLRRGDPVQKWVKERLENARWFLDAIEQRQSTLLRIAKAIFHRQEVFLDKGLKALQPMRMQEVADEVGVHISTVSRAVAGKYAQTPHGILALRFFFTGGTAKAEGGMASQISIKQRIKEIVEAEDGQNPLSDDQLAHALAERDGIKIARRTVTKYRKALDIPSSSQRRQF
jgi:RNA polymerase sigma-54 factor